MKGLRDQYDGTDAVLGYIGKVIKSLSLHEHLNMPGLDSTSETKPLCTGQSNSDFQAPTKQRRLNSDGLAEILVFWPRIYLRISLAIDFALARGRFPTVAEFPTQLQPVESTITLPLYKEVPSELRSLLSPSAMLSPSSNGALEEIGGGADNDTLATKMLGPWSPGVESPATSNSSLQILQVSASLQPIALKEYKELRLGQEVMEPCPIDPWTEFFLEAISNRDLWS